MSRFVDDLEDRAQFLILLRSWRSHLSCKDDELYLRQMNLRTMHV